MAYKAITAKFHGKCKACGLHMMAGDAIVWESLHKATYCEACGQVAMAKAAAAAKAAAGAKAALAGLKAKGMPTVAPAAEPTNWSPNKAKPLTATMGYQPSAAIVPKTQKGKGIQVLQQAGLLPAAMATVCQTEAQAVAAFEAIPGRRFARPCPTEPRHGFVDSREVKSAEEVRQVWAETRAADPAGEVVLMPLVEAEYNCVWRPGLLAVGPGHDGATAGNSSISVFLTPEYSQAWKDLSTKAGVKLDTQAPFIEAVSHSGIDTVVTQIRGGVKDCPTEPDWNPAPMTVGAVVAVDGSVKADSEAMLAWESQAKTLTPGFHIVYDEGGNLADHWSVHAQLNGIAVVTSFKPHVGQEIPKLGMDLVPFEPQAIVWGFLGGLLGPSLKADNAINRRNRTRATVAAIMGTHHGMRMGGDAGVHLGASVALFLRLGQAAVWGEARHAWGCKHGFDPAEVPMIAPAKNKQRQQIFTMILDDWQAGRAGLRDVTRVFHGSWQGSMGGKAWAAISHAVVALDAAMVNLIRIPSQTNAKRVVEKLTTAVNLAHNGVSAGCFLNKFCSADWFDLAAALDPRAACFAGPIWYEAAQVDPAKRMALLDAIDGYAPIEVGMKAPEGNVLAGMPKVAQQTKIKPVGGHGGYASILDIPKPKAVTEPTAAKPYGGKVGSFYPVRVGHTPELPGVPKAACCKGGGGDSLHVQIALTAGGYVSGEVALKDQAESINGIVAGLPVMPSMSGSGVDYHTLTVEAGAIKAGDVVVLTLTAGK